MAVSKKSIVLGAFLAAMLFGTVSADLFGLGTIFTNPTGVSCSTNSSGLEWIPIAFVALFLGTMLTAFGWTLSGVFAAQKYADFLRARLWELVETGAILSILSLAIAGMSDYGVANIDKARAYSVVIRNTVGLDFAVTVGVSMGFSWLSNATPSLRPFGQNGFYLSFQVAPMFKPIYDLLGILLQLMTATLVQWIAHGFMLCFVKAQMLTLLLPLGIFLRAFGIKAGGNALIGIALAFYFVYPLMLVQTGEIVHTHMLNEIKALPNPPEHTWYNGAGLSCSAAKPMCCVGYDPFPASSADAYLPNGPDWDAPWPASAADRISVKSVLDGGFYVGLNGQPGPSVGSGATCVYSTLPAKLYSGVIGTISNPENALFSLGFMGSYGLFKKQMAGKNIRGIYSTPADVQRKLQTANVRGGLPVLPILNWFNRDWVKLFALYPVTGMMFQLIYSTVYFLFIISLVMPIFIVFITITFAKEVAKVLGTEIDLSSLEKLI